jgi:two-component system cell cycle response regulator DivK
MRERLVLVVEDDQCVRDLLEAALALPELADLGPLAVLTAPHAAAAFARMDGRVPDLVLLDVLLPGMDGTALCRRMRADPRLRAVPVVAVTAIGLGDGGEEKARAAGCDGYLAKPFDLDDLLAAVRRWLGT